MANEKESKVYILSEIGFDSAQFNEEAFQNALEFMSKDATGLIIDGPLTRVDRPEFLSERLTYWDKSLDECKKATEEIPNKEQYEQMIDEQMCILEEKLSEIRKQLPETDIFLNIASDDLQYTTSAVLNERLLRNQGLLDEQISGTKDE